MIFHLNKNRSQDNKKLEFKSSTIDRYSSTQENGEMNLRFPVIERRSYATLNQDGQANTVDLRERLRVLERQEKKERERPREGKEGRYEEEMSAEEKKLKNTRTLENRFKIREELYGLLPSFRGPNIHQEVLKKNKYLSSQQHKFRV